MTAPPSPLDLFNRPGKGLLLRLIRSRIGRPLQSFAYASRVMHLAAHVRGQMHGAVILMYHSVATGEAQQFIDPRNHVPADVFEQQMAFLARHRRVVALTELADTIARGGDLPPNAVAITFDDGYLDNLSVAAPILTRLNLPATLFLPTGFIDRAEPQWIDQVYTAFHFRSASTLEWDDASTIGRFDLDQAAEHADAYRTVCQTLLAARPDDRRAMLDAIQVQLRPTASPPQLTMAWDDVHTLLNEHPGFDIGGHTVEHTNLATVDADEAKQELIQCRDHIASKTGTAPRHFSFPYGRTSPALRQRVAEAGFTSSCGSGGGDAVARHDTDLFALPRVEAPASMRRFDMLTSPVNTGLWRRLGR